ncbi:hypothetical protein EXS62_01160 [Candidatus Kaiserbacteria bacterium]|nr:hypothetical protein [Candidatus Kaiserbacteria bacterium]
MDREKLLAEAEAFFCRGMATDSYASGAKAHPVEDWLGWEAYEYREGDLRLVDMYTVDPDTGKSFGNTYIHYQGRTIWMMSYGGFYKKEATPCLKSALMANYTRGIFDMGRGQNGFADGAYIYLIGSYNPSCSFERFYAREGIRQHVPGGKELESVGGHEVWGMAVI